MAANLDAFVSKHSTAHPMIYAYSDSNPAYSGLLKVGFTSVDIDARVAQQYPTKRPDGSVPYRIVVRESAMLEDGGSFTDREVHKMLRLKAEDVVAAVIAVRTGTANVENRTQSFKMRPEQEKAVNRTTEYYRSAYEENSVRAPKFLWNAKMRFGKTFAAYQLAKRMGMTRILEPR